MTHVIGVAVLMEIPILRRLAVAITSVTFTQHDLDGHRFGLCSARRLLWESSLAVGVEDGAKKRCTHAASQSHPLKLGTI